MEGLLTEIVDWIGTNAWWIALVSVIYFLVSLFLIRFFIIWIPYDYFLEKKKDDVPVENSFGRFVLHLGKNLLGIIVIIIGLIMSIPGVAGQGFLTILLGLTLTDFPGKRRLEVRLIRQPLIRSVIASLRQKSGKPPLALPPEGEDSR